MVSFRTFRANDAVEIALQPSQHVTLGITQATHSIEEALTLEQLGPAWTAVAADGRILACYGFGFQFPPNERTGGHALAWALLASGLGTDHLAITRHARSVVEGSPIARIEAIVRPAIEAEPRWVEAIGFTRVAELRSWGPTGETHVLYERVREHPQFPRQVSAPHLEALGAC
jgi:hypothetical protein